MLCMSGAPLNLPAPLPFVPGPVGSKDSSSAVLMVGRLELFIHSEPDFPHLQFASLTELFYVQACLTDSNLSLKRPGIIQVPLNLARRTSKLSKWSYKSVFSCTSDLVDDLVLSPLPPPASISNALTFSCRHFIPSAVTQTLHVFCTLLVSAHLVCAGIVCLLPGVSQRVGWPPSERSVKALLCLHAKISDFLTSGAVVSVLLHCLPTETEFRLLSSNYCVHPENSRKNIISSLCLRSDSFYNTNSARYCLYEEKSVCVCFENTTSQNRFNFIATLLTLIANIFKAEQKCNVFLLVLLSSSCCFFFYLILLLQTENLSAKHKRRQVQL